MFLLFGLLWARAFGFCLWLFALGLAFESKLWAFRSCFAFAFGLARAWLLPFGSGFGRWLGFCLGLCLGLGFLPFWLALPFGVGLALPWAFENKLWAFARLLALLFCLCLVLIRMNF